MDHLIEQIRERAADPAKRVDERPSELWASVNTMSLGGMVGMLRGLNRDLGRLIRQGPDDELVGRANDIQRSMRTPAEQPLPPPATLDQVAATEAALGLRLPPLLRRLYLEVANGGFGPGPGLLGVRGGARSIKGRSMEELHRTMLEARDEHASWMWPPALLPVVDDDGSFLAIDTSVPDGKVVAFDFEELEDDSPRNAWRQAFRDIAPSYERWLAEWAAAGADPHRVAAQAALDPEAERVMTDVPEVTRAYWAAMTPEQRAGYGLPETGWGRALFGDAWGDDPRDGSGT